MNENALHSDEQAALIDAHKQARALLNRYRYLAEELIDDQNWQPFLADRQRKLDGLRQQLASRLDQQGLLPEDFNADLEDLAHLADRFREWLDGDRHEPLRKALTERERSLLETLRALPASERSGLARAIDEAEASIEYLAED
ncbi:MAG: hypothetical protein V2J10_09090 [Wenzhouxiangella sp.]|jgi:hypothetical protein|nr:hypothetical protein [Wenzhouxiangella sp.]